MWRTKRKQLDELKRTIGYYGGVNTELMARMDAIRMLTDPKIPITEVLDHLEDVCYGTE